MVFKKIKIKQGWKTKNDLKKRFAEYNNLYFQNKPNMPLFNPFLAPL